MKDITKFDPNAPAFGAGSQAMDDEGNLIVQPSEKPAVVSDEATAEEVKVEPKKEEQVESSVEEENKVPYSRFKKFHDAAKDAEKEAEFYRNQYESLKSQRKEVEETNEPPTEWKELYGESDQSTRAWKLQQTLNERLSEEAIEKAISAVKSERLQEEERLDENINELDSREERLENFIGRKLTEKESTALLDITDEFTPKGEDGNYLGALLSEEKAWEIYEMKQKSAQAPKKESRDKVASLSGSQTQGETNVGPDRNKDFNPSWGAVSESVRKYGL